MNPCARSGESKGAKPQQFELPLVVLPKGFAQQSLDRLSGLLHPNPYHWVIGEALLSRQTRHLAQFPLRLAKSLREAADAMAMQQGISLNHFIAIALAEKISRIEHQATSSPNRDLRKDSKD